jgi:Domain of Unknown Function (DUF1206)
VLHRLLTRLGYAALGVVYAALGVVAFEIALAGARDHVKGFPAGFRYLLSHPYGPTVVACIAAGLAAFVVARLLDAGDRKRPTLARCLAFGDAIGHAGLAWMAVSLLLRIRRGPGFSRPFLEWLLSQPWGKTTLEVTGFGVIAFGALQIWMGVGGGRLGQQLAAHRLGAAAPYAIHVGRFGRAVRGLVTAIIGWFLVRVARDLDPREFREIGGALEVLHKMRFGGLLLAIAGAGLCAYGAYLVLLGFFRKAR